jgi:hypothetical protein
MICDSATGLSRGTDRDRAATVAADFAVGAPMGFLVLCGARATDGLRRCTAVVTEIFSELTFRRDHPAELAEHFNALLAHAASEALVAAGWRHGHQPPQPDSDAPQLLVAAVFGDRLCWLATGGVELLLVRRGEMRAPQAQPQGTDPAGGWAWSAGETLLLPGDTLLAASRRLSEPDLRRVRATLAAGGGLAVSEVAAALVEALAAGPDAPATAFCLLRTR